MNKFDCKVIVVTHNSKKYIDWLLSGLESAKTRIKIDIIDSGSSDVEYLDLLKTKHEIKIVKTVNIGFVQGNNMALDDLDECRWVLFLNPDARIEGEDLDELLEFCDKIPEENTGIYTVPLKRFDIDNKIPTGYYDSQGIKCNWYGKWVDISSGEKIEDEKNKPVYKQIEAACGAFMLVKNSVLMSCLDKNNKRGFENSYYMYKEDIELSLRVKCSGGINLIYNKVTAFHCRGWNKKRKDVPYWAKYSSAKNDVDLAVRYKYRALPYALLKYLWVRVLESKNK